MLAILRLYSIIDRMTIECGAAGGMKIGRRSWD
jgi:hypothetical protein